ncbi:MAG TPA: YlzJ-like family protein [Bacillales bacterium]|nr:YlzJ-like family protein [Bacillales bacterium]
MILYTVMPDQAVLSGDEEIEEHSKRQRYIEMGGRQILIEAISEDQCKMIRLISGNPQDYLDARFQPGNIITMKPQI